jgi:hypothetical protein
VVVEESGEGEARDIAVHAQPKCDVAVHVCGPAEPAPFDRLACSNVAGLLTGASARLDSLLRQGPARVFGIQHRRPLNGMAGFWLGCGWVEGKALYNAKSGRFTNNEETNKYLQLNYCRGREIDTRS